MITIHAWQWDTDIPVRIPYAGTAAPELDFMPDTGTGQTVRPALSDGILTAQCPPQLLTSSRPIQIYARQGNTIDRVGVICIRPRPKPPDYIDTPADVRTWEEHEKRIQAVEDRAETDPTVPEWAKQPQKPTYTAAEVGALPDTTEIPETLPNPFALNFTGAFSGSYDGTQPVTVEIPEAIAPPTVAEIGQTIIVKAVDDTGKPTEWECANVGETITLEETVLASGTIAAADIVKGMKLDTGLTVADMKKWKTFSFRYETTSANICINFKFSNPAAPAYCTILYYEWCKSMSAFFTWVDTKKTALRIDNATKNTLAPGIGSAMVANGWMNRFANANQVSQYIKHHMADNYKVMIENAADGVDADLKWEIRGILK